MGKDEKEFTLTVNGDQIKTPHQRLVAHDVLELAEKAGAISGDPNKYILKGDKGEYGPDDWVDLEEDSVFVAVPNTSTPVARL